MNKEIIIQVNLPAFITIVMPRMDRVTHINDVFALFNIGVTFMAHEPAPFGLFIGITTLAQRPNVRKLKRSLKYCTKSKL